MDLDRAVDGLFNTILSTVAEPVIGVSGFVAALIFPMVLALILRLWSTAGVAAVLIALAVGAFLAAEWKSNLAPFSIWLGLFAWAAALILVASGQIRRSARKREMESLRLQALERKYQLLAAWKERRELEAMYQRFNGVSQAEEPGDEPREVASPRPEPQLARLEERKLSQ